MRDVNKMILVGRLGADPVQRLTKTGTPVVNFSVATSRKSYRDDSETAKDTSKEDSLIEETQWHKVVAWGKRGEACFQYLKKGHAVYVEGFVRSHQYNDKDGQARTSFEVIAEDVSFLGGTRPETKTENSDPIPF